MIGVSLMKMFPSTILEDSSSELQLGEIKSKMKNKKKAPGFPGAFLVELGAATRLPGLQLGVTLFHPNLFYKYLFVVCKVQKIHSGSEVLNRNAIAGSNRPTFYNGAGQADQLVFKIV